MLPIDSLSPRHAAEASFFVSMDRSFVPSFLQGQCLLVSPCWKKKNDVAKMRQAGTAPATGTTIYCLTSLWCAVIYKHCSVMDTTNTLLQANVRLVLRLDLCLSDILCYLWMYLEYSEFRSIRSSCVRHSIGARIGEGSCLSISTDRLRHLDEYGAACALNYGSTRVPKPARPNYYVNGRVTKPAGLCGSCGWLSTH